MEDGFRLSSAKVAIVGLGLMGGSLALALKGKCAALYAVDVQPATLERALAERIVERADSDPANVLPGADLVVLSTPVPVIIDFIRRLPDLVPGPCIVLDLGSTKTKIVQALASLPERFDPLGGHPICGKEKLGIEHADGRLFENTPFILTALERTSERAKSAARQIADSLGARVIEMSAEDHDQALAATSHFPFLLSSALALSTPQDFAAFIGTGFKSTSRLAGTPAHMTMGILQSNRENILHASQAFRNSLAQIEALLQEENYPQLELVLNQSRAAYQSLIPGN